MTITRAIAMTGRLTTQIYACVYQPRNDFFTLTPPPTDGPTKKIRVSVVSTKKVNLLLLFFQNAWIGFLFMRRGVTHSSGHQPNSGLRPFLGRDALSPISQFVRQLHSLRGNLTQFQKTVLPHLLPA